MIECKECHKQFDKISSIHRHVSRKHGISVEEYRIKYEFNKIRPKCHCGCGNAVSWNKGKPKRFIRGHANKDPIIRKAMIEGGKRAAGDPEKRKKNSDALIMKWKDSSYRKKCLSSLSVSFKKRIKKIKATKNTQQYKKEASRRKSEWWKDQKNKTMMKKIFLSQSFRDAVSKGTTRALLDPIKRNKLSQLASKNQALGIIGPNKTKRSLIFNPFTLQQEHVDSSWERLFLEQAIKRGIALKRNKEIIIPYIDHDGTHRRYVPDFLTLTGRTIIEIKGRVTETDKIKIEHLKSFCEKNNKHCAIFLTKSSILNDSYWKKIL